MSNWFIYIIFFLPAISVANKLCPAESSVREVADCLIEETQRADSELKRYLDAAKSRYEDDPEMVGLIDLSQSEWVKYRNAHCNAVYQDWSEGTMRLIHHPYCLLYTTKARNYDVWREFLVYQDSTEPVLPEPQLILYKQW